jgi:hypothetical protein
MTFGLKNSSMDGHLAYLRLALERMCRYGLKMYVWCVGW